jgi:hypothetical protein
LFHLLEQISETKVQGVLNLEGSRILGCSPTSSENFDSGSVDPGGKFEHTFNTPGSFSYHCEIHGTDSTGIKLANRGAVDIKKKRILSLEVTSEELHDGKILKKLVQIVQRLTFKLINSRTGVLIHAWNGM